MVDYQPPSSVLILRFGLRMEDVDDVRFAVGSFDGTDMFTTVVAIFI